MNIPVPHMVEGRHLPDVLEAYQKKASELLSGNNSLEIIGTPQIIHVNPAIYIIFFVKEDSGNKT